jgi:hypothetical protein
VLREMLRVGSVRIFKSYELDRARIDRTGDSRAGSANPATK